MANIDSTMEKPTVLIVDDSPDDIALIGELLKDLYKIKIAGNGERALKVAQTGTPPELHPRFAPHSFQMGTAFLLILLLRHQSCVQRRYARCRP